jgi:hypothetical protein
MDLLFSVLFGFVCCGLPFILFISGLIILGQRVRENFARGAAESARLLEQDPTNRAVRKRVRWTYLILYTGLGFSLVVVAAIGVALATQYDYLRAVFLPDNVYWLIGFSVVFLAGIVSGLAIMLVAWRGRAREK